MPIPIPGTGGRSLCPLCGPKLAIFCMIISGWGIIFMGVLGLFYYTESVLLFEDIGYHKSLKDMMNNLSEPELNYKTAAYKCWIAGALYAVTLVAAFWQNKWNPSSVF